VLKPMLESAIIMNIFSAVRKRKKDPTKDTPKPRTSLFQEGENDVFVSSLKIPAGDVQTYHNVISDSYLKVGFIVVSLNENNGNNILFDAMPMRHTFFGGEFRNNHHSTIDVQKSNLIDTLS
jgi:DNA-binding cell septation regulator SpoVG